MASLHGSLDLGAARLVTRNNVSRFYSLPNAYERRIAAIPGVQLVAAANYFGGMRDANNPDSEFPNFAIEAEKFLAMYPEYGLAEVEKKAFLGNQHGASSAARLQRSFIGRLGRQFS